MLGENLKTLRRQRGMSQETLAQQLHVVRQTVSKWEKGLSVPDADMLVRIADLFEVSVDGLLGADISPKPDTNEIAVQLALLNEQMANRSRRNKKIIKGILIALLVIFLLALALLIVGIAVNVMAEPKDETMTETTLTCTLDGEEYVYAMTYDDNFSIVFAGGDAFIADHVQTDHYDDANVLIAQIEDYFSDRGGSVRRSDQMVDQDNNPVKEQNR